jgi:hypothetical protein
MSTIFCHTKFKKSWPMVMVISTLLRWLWAYSSTYVLCGGHLQSLSKRCLVGNATMRYEKPVFCQNWPGFLQPFMWERRLIMLVTSPFCHRICILTLEFISYELLEFIL